MSHLSSIDKSIIQDLNLPILVPIRSLPKFVSWTKPVNNFYKFKSNRSSFGNPI